MRKHTVLTTLALAFSLIILTQFATTQVRANEIKADLNIDPDSLRLTEEGFGMWMTAYIGLPEGYNVTDIIVSSVTLHVLGESFGVSMDIKGNELMYEIKGDKLIVKFDRVMVTRLLWSMIDHMTLHIREKGPLDLEVTGELDDGTTFRGKDTITVFFTQPLIQP